MSDEKDLKPQGQPQTDATEKTEAGDPQEKMEGPISSLVKGAGDAFESDQTKADANREKDEAMSTE